MVKGSRIAVHKAAWALVALAAAGGAARAETLADALTLAYQTNPTLQTERAQLRAIDETYVQARAAYRPQASVSAEADYVNGPGTRSVYGYGPPVPTWPDAATLSVSQTLFSGGQISAEVRATMGDILSGREKLRAGEAQVLLAVVQAYVDVRRDTQALAIAQDNVAVLKRELEEARARFDVGQVTRTDVAQSEARLAGGQSQLSTAQAQLGVTRANYLALVGQSPGELAPEPPLVGLPASVDEAFAAANKENPGVIAADYAEQAAAARVAEAKAANHPTVSLRASYGYDGYLRDQSAIIPGQVPGIYTPSISASAVVTQPLFTGGYNGSRIRQALENDNTQRIAVESARRQATLSVSQAWNQLLAARANVASSEQQVRSNEVAFDGAKQEAEVGSRTTLDVLNAEQELQTARLALINARHDQYVAGASVLSAMGRLEARYLMPKLPLYDPQKSFKKVRGDGYVPWESLVAGADRLVDPTTLHTPRGATSQPAPSPKTPVVPAQAGGQVVQ
jgi:outer membrane protein